MTKKQLAIEKRAERMDVAEARPLAGIAIKTAKKK
jgi:hypothetical protein